MNVPEDLCYAKTHEWVRQEGEVVTVGISDHAQHELSDVVYIEPPEAGREVAAGEACCVVESVKAASDIYAPLAGKVVAVNATVVKDPALLNTDPYGEGWIFKLQVSSEAGAELLSAADYRAQIGG